jgi:protein-S-isoprenylcysteine O-methyltransferase Ste14
MLLSGKHGPRFVLAVLLVSVLAVRSYYHARSVRNIRKSKFLEGRTHVVARLTAVISGFAVIGFYLARPDLLAWSELPIPLWAQWLGAPLGMLALFALVWIHRTLGNNFSGTLHIQEDHQLVTPPAPTAGSGIRCTPRFIP